MADTELKKQETGTQTETEVKTFTQDELNRIVQERVAKERASIDELKAKASKFDEMEEANKTELQKATEKADALQKEFERLKKANELTAIRQKIAEETGVSASYLNGSTEEECRAIASNFVAFAEANKVPVAPTVKDGGESRPESISKADILAIENEKDRLKAIKENIDLFKG